MTSERINHVHKALELNIQLGIITGKSFKAIIQDSGMCQ